MGGEGGDVHLYWGCPFQFLFVSRFPDAGRVTQMTLCERGVIRTTDSCEGKGDSLRENLLERRNGTFGMDPNNSRVRRRRRRDQLVGERQSPGGHCPV